MKQAFEILKIGRNNMLNVVKDLTLDQLNVIPQGFNNNLMWNIGHVVVTQQLLCYKLSGLPLNIDDKMVTNFAKGSLPSPNFEREDYEQIKKELLRMPDVLISDYENGIFKDFNTYPTSFGYDLNSIDDAILFNNVHEGMHLGYLMALKRAVLSLS